MRAISILLLQLAGAALSASLPDNPSPRYLLSNVIHPATLPSNCSDCISPQLRQPAPTPWSYPLPNLRLKIATFGNYSSRAINPDNFHEMILNAKNDAALFDPRAKTGKRSDMIYAHSSASVFFIPTDDTMWGDWEAMLDALEVFAQRWDLVELDFQIQFVGHPRQDLGKGKVFLNGWEMG